jgi:hypothetical protein
MSTRANELENKKDQLRRSIMKTFASALIALAVLTGVVAPLASANAATSLAEQLEKEGRFGHAI